MPPFKWSHFAYAPSGTAAEVVDDEKVDDVPGEITDEEVAGADKGEVEPEVEPVEEVVPSYRDYFQKAIQRGQHRPLHSIRYAHGVEVAVY